jgi:uncharacterized protein (DUF1330 family)
MRAYVLVDIEITDPVRYSRYVEAVPPTISAHGGSYLARGGRTITLEGDWRPPRCAVLEFESLERAKQWWDSPEYRAVHRLREGAAKARIVAVEGI